MEATNKNLSDIMQDLTRFQNMKEFEEERERMKGVRQGLMDGLSIDLDLDDKLRELYMKYPLEEIRRMDQERFDSIFIIDGEPVRFGKDRKFETTRDSICYFYEMDIANKNIDDAIAEMDKTFAESREEMEAIFAELGSYNNIIREAMVQDIERQEGAQKANTEEMLRWYDDALQLGKYEEYIRTTSPERWQKIFYDMNASRGVIEKFERKAKKFNSPIHKGNVQQFFLMEHKHLPEEYWDRTNLFLYTWIRYIAYLNEHKEDRFKRLYALRIALYLKQLMQGTLEAEYKEPFLASIQRILDILSIDGYKERDMVDKYLAMKEKQEQSLTETVEEDTTEESSEQ